MCLYQAIKFLLIYLDRELNIASSSNEYGNNNVLNRNIAISYRFKRDH